VRGAVVAVSLAGSVSLVAYRRRTLTLDGAFAATAVGATVFARAGIPGAGALIAFFISSSVLSRVREANKGRGDLAQAKGARRDAWQVLANGGVAAVCAVLGWRDGLVGALATAAADTWATEVGLLYGARPRLITTFQPVEAGTSGGITVQGLLASVGGAAVVAAAWRCCRGETAGPGTSVMAGVAGALADSLLGATLQGVFRCRACGAVLETPRGHQAELLRGYGWIDNDVVNLLATCAGASVGMLVWRIYRTRRSR
jgi:uncharacterized protein (TIGR00297 family)